MVPRTNSYCVTIYRPDVTMCTSVISFRNSKCYPQSLCLLGFSEQTATISRGECKFVSQSNKVPRHEDVYESDGITPCILNVGTRRRWAVGSHLGRPTPGDTGWAIQPVWLRWQRKYPSLREENNCPLITSWSLRDINVLSAVREEYRACRWTEDFLLVSDKES
jgi:hypothetical protein